MTTFNQGDVVLVNFVFPDENGVKRRPGLIISSDDYQSGRNEVIIAAITSRTDRILVGDHLINNWQGAGLLFPSTATGIIRTIKNEMVTHKLGTMPPGDIQEIENKLRLMLGL